nr:hypothetical protein 10 [bacterium]
MTEETTTTETTSPDTATADAGGAESTTETSTVEGGAGGDDLLFNDSTEGGDGDDTSTGGDDTGEGGNDTSEGGEKDGKAETVEYEEFTLPEGFEVDEAAMGKFKEFAQGKNLSQEDAQALVNMYTDLLQKEQDNLLNEIDGWKKEVEADQELGGNNLKATVKACNDVVRKFGGEELKDQLKQFGLGNNIHMVRFLHNIAKATKEDDIAGSTGGTPPDPKTFAQAVGVSQFTGGKK